MKRYFDLNLRQLLFPRLSLSDLDPPPDWNGGHGPPLRSLRHFRLLRSGKDFQGSREGLGKRWQTGDPEPETV